MNEMQPSAYNPPAHQQAGLPVEASQTLPNPAWTKVMGIFTIIGGAIYSITIVYAVFGIPLIFIGLAMYRGSEHADRYIATGEHGYAHAALVHLLKAAKIQGIMAIVTFAVIVVGLIVYMIIIFLVIGTAAATQQG